MHTPVPATPGSDLTLVGAIAQSIELFVVVILHKDSSGSFDAVLVHTLLLGRFCYSKQLLIDLEIIIVCKKESQSSEFKSEENVTHSLVSEPVVEISGSDVVGYTKS